jgi:hypothetical protein
VADWWAAVGSRESSAEVDPARGVSPGIAQSYEQPGRLGRQKKGHGVLDPGAYQQAGADIAADLSGRPAKSWYRSTGRRLMWFVVSEAVPPPQEGKAAYIIRR